MIPIFNRGHIFSFGEYPDEVGLVVEAAVVAYLRCASGGAGQQVAGLCHSQVVDIGDEGYAGLSLEEMAECRVRHIHELRRI